MDILIVDILIVDILRVDILNLTQAAVDIIYLHVHLAF